jgi:hypothetical protein
VVAEGSVSAFSPVSGGSGGCRVGSFHEFYVHLRITGFHRNVIVVRAKFSSFGMATCCSSSATVALM